MRSRHGQRQPLHRQGRLHHRRRETDAASGIGQAAAVAIAQRGARVVVSDPTEDALRRTRDAVRDAGGEALAVACDVAGPEQVEAAVARGVEAFGRPEEIAEAVLWMCSNLGGFVTGAAISVDGGWSF